MDYPRFPDWLIYFAATGAILVAAVSRQEHANTPEAPPPPPGAERVPLGPSSPFDPVTVIRTGAHRGQPRGTAFAVGEGGLWLTARSQVQGCERLVLKVAEGRAVGARLQPGDDPSLAVLRTEGGPPVLILAPAHDLASGTRAFLIGFPRGAPGEASAMLIARHAMPRPYRDDAAVVAQVWAETGRTEAMKGDLPGLAGAPVLGADQRVIGVILRQDKARARFWAAGPQQIAHVLEASGIRPTDAAAAEPITVANYGRVGDDLRRSRQVAQVLCLMG